jgi:C-terminal processing protease CtpA/Prc
MASGWAEYRPGVSEAEGGIITAGEKSGPDRGRAVGSGSRPVAPAGQTGREKREGLLKVGRKAPLVPAPAAARRGLADGPRFRRRFAIALASALAIAAATRWADATPRRNDFRKDFEFACAQIASTYAYFDAKATSWADVPRLYDRDLQRVATRGQFIGVLERVLDELYDPHAQLTVNTPSSPRLVPSGTDLWAEWQEGRAVITEVRAGSDAERAGIAPGAVIVAIDGVPVADAVDSRMGRTYPHTVAPARDWALRAVLAGRHDARRALELREGDATRTVELPSRDQFGTAAALPVIHSKPQPGIGYVRFQDSLGDDRTVDAFDRALDELRETRALILDLRDTPSGGNSSVARGILGRFVGRESPYQKHVLTSEERETGIRRSWLELVSPRGAFVYRRPVAVLVDHWTGSMGEGVAIGLNAVDSATIVGTPMAGLAGATYHVTLPRTGIGMNVPAERLYHVDGTPRETFRPDIPVDVSRVRPGEDPFLAAALLALAEKTATPPAP